MMLCIYLPGFGISAEKARGVRVSYPLTGRDRQRPHDAIVKVRVGPNLELSDVFARGQVYCLFGTRSGVAIIWSIDNHCVPKTGVGVFGRSRAVSAGINSVGELHTVDVSLRLHPNLGQASGELLKRHLTIFGPFELLLVK